MKSAKPWLAILSVFLFAAAGPASQNETLDKGNRLIAKGQFSAAEMEFREVLKVDPDNAVFRNQLALCLLQQKKYAEAETELDRVLQRSPRDIAALWYRAQNSFTSERYREAADRVKAVQLLLDKQSPQYFASFWFLATSRKATLLKSFDAVQSELKEPAAVDDLGLTQAEVDEMLDAYETYLRLQPSAADRKDVKRFMKWVEKNRPPSNVRRWVVSSPPEE